MTYLPDVNVWIALTAARHVHHRTASQWFKGLQDDGLAFCRVTQMGFLRLLTNKHVMQEEVMVPDHSLEGLSRTAVGPPNRLLGRAELTPRGMGFVYAKPVDFAKSLADVYLCAFASAARLTLVTFDSRIPVWENVKCLVLPGSS
jgi:uncharacterized protein